jgi:predicted RNase H-like HicB family nuclease
MLAYRQKSTASRYPLSDVRVKQVKTGTPIQVVTADLTAMSGVVLNTALASDTKTTTPMIFLPPSLTLSYILASGVSGIGYSILRPIPVVVEQNENSFVASFVAANLHASGESISEAFDNLKSYIGDVFEELSQIGRQRLGPGPRRELAILEQYVQERP